jgi:hypothetical protein
MLYQIVKSSFLFTLIEDTANNYADYGMLRRLRQQGVDYFPEMQKLTHVRRDNARNERNYAQYMKADWMPWFIQLLDELPFPVDLKVIDILPGHYVKLAKLRKQRAQHHKTKILLHQFLDCSNQNNLLVLCDDPSGCA